MRHLPQPHACQLFTPSQGQAHCACVNAQCRGGGGVVVQRGVHCPLSLLTWGPLGTVVGAVHRKVSQWFSSLNQNVDHTGAKIKIKAHHSTECRASQKPDAIIMSEVREIQIFIFFAQGGQHTVASSLRLILSCSFQLFNIYTHPPHPNYVTCGTQGTETAV